MGRKSFWSAAVALAALGLAMQPTSARADAISFRPDPINQPGLVIQIGGLDQKAGSALSIGAVPVINAGGGSAPIVVQASLSSFLDPSLNPLSDPSGFKTNYQILSEARFSETLTPTGGGNVSFALAPVQPTNVFTLLYHPGGNATLSDQTGAGFDAAGGNTVILTGHLVAAGFTGSVTTTGATSPPSPSTPGGLNNSLTGPADNATVNFSGSTSFTVVVDSMNPLFFPNPNQKITFLNFSASNNAPFVGSVPNGAGFGGSPTFAQAHFFDGTTRNIGTTNGFTASGPDVELEADARNVFAVITATTPGTSIPEIDPGSIAGALTLLGGGLLYMTDRRRRNKK